MEPDTREIGPVETVGVRDNGQEVSWLLLWFLHTLGSVITAGSNSEPAPRH